MHDLHKINHQHTLGHIDCPVCSKERSEVLDSIVATLPFGEAAGLFIQLRSTDATPDAISARYVRETTSKAYERYRRSLELFFQGMQLADIHWFNMRSYQKCRVAGAEPFHRYRRPQDAKPRRSRDVIIPAKGKSPCPAKPAQVNQELAFLKRLKKLASCWTFEDQKFYKELVEEESDVQRALSPEEQSHWLDVARSRERWNVVHWYSIVAFDTTMSTNELRGLRLGDVNLEQRLITIPWAAAKNRYRKRSITLENAECLWALGKLLERAYEAGASSPLHYLFPMRDGRTREYDPTRHMTVSGIKKQWEEVRDAADLKWFRQYDTRHTGITRLAEEGWSVPMLKSRAGHFSDSMSEHYTHVTVSAQRRWQQMTPGMRFAPQSVRPYRPAASGSRRW